MHVRCSTNDFLLVTFVKDEFVSNVVQCAFFNPFENPVFIFYTDHCRNFNKWPHLRTDDLSTGFKPLKVPNWAPISSSNWCMYSLVFLYAFSKCSTHEGPIP